MMLYLGLVVNVVSSYPTRQYGVVLTRQSASSCTPCGDATSHPTLPFNSGNSVAGTAYSGRPCPQLFTACNRISLSATCEPPSSRHYFWVSSFSWFRTCNNLGIIKNRIKKTKVEKLYTLHLPFTV